MRQYKKIETIAGVHSWLRRIHGVANRCDFCKTKNTYRYEWSLKKGCKYEPKIENFQQLCVKCHRNYDMTDETRKKMSIAKKGKPPPENALRAIRKKVYQFDRQGNFINKFVSITKAAKELNLCINLISEVATGSNPNRKTTGGFIFKYKN